MSTAGKAAEAAPAGEFEGTARICYMLNGKMKPRAIEKVLFLAIIGVLLSSGRCSLFRAKGPAAPPFRENFSLLEPKDFPEKIKQLEEISQTDPSMAVRTRALFYIALAHMHYKNPSPDYSQAVQYLDKYIAADSADEDIDEIVAWKSIVQALAGSLREYEKLEKSYAQLKQQNDRANKKINDLGQVIEKQKKEIESLNATLKKLDAVEQEIEKKKKGIKK
jgi:tetratricopeptide (TPR) repeat protein